MLTTTITITVLLFITATTFVSCQDGDSTCVATGSDFKNKLRNNIAVDSNATNFAKEFRLLASIQSDSATECCSQCGSLEYFRCYLFDYDEISKNCIFFSTIKGFQIQKTLKFLINGNDRSAGYWSL
jgi:hypothetical protein